MRFRIGIHCLMATWVAANVWAAKPYQWESFVSTIAMWVIFCSNPLMFGLAAWLGWRRAARAVGTVYPALALSAWLFGPPSFAMYRWGSDVFATVWLRVLSWYSLGYIVFCLVVYGTVAAAGKRLRREA